MWSLSKNAFFDKALKWIIYSAGANVRYIQHIGHILIGSTWITSLPSEQVLKIQKYVVWNYAWDQYNFSMNQASLLFLFLSFLVWIVLFKSPGSHPGVTQESPRRVTRESHPEESTGRVTQESHPEESPRRTIQESPGRVTQKVHLVVSLGVTHTEESTIRVIQESHPGVTWESHLGESPRKVTWESHPEGIWEYH